jgi:hypothetical protein
MTTTTTHNEPGNSTCPVKILERVIFVKFTVHPVPPSRLEFHLVLADTGHE